MFEIHAEPTFKKKVGLTRAGHDAPLQVEFTFKHKGRTAFAEWRRRVLEEGTGTVDAEAESLCEVIADWDHLGDKGERVKFSKEALATLLEEHHTAGGEIFSAYIKALTESRVKN